MRTLQRSFKIAYRFRCERCRSLFEMTEEEKRENDIKFTDDWAKQLEIQEKYDIKATPHNPMDYFDCPVCNCRRYVMKEDMHKYSVMEDGTEIQIY